MIQNTAISTDYLFDGDMKGFTSMAPLTGITWVLFIAGPMCFGKPLFELDLKEAETIRRSAGFIRFCL